MIRAINQLRFLPLIALFTLLLVSSCSKKEVAPADVTDALSNTVWEAYGYKDPVYGKDVYYYLAFGVNGKAQQYAKYNKIDLVNDIPTELTYTLAGSTLTLKYPTTTLTGEYASGKIKINTTLINFVYTKL